jgi:cytochrome c6
VIAGMPYRVSILVIAAAIGTLTSNISPAQSDGGILFVQNCSACHQRNGKGLPGVYPALAGDAFVTGAVEQVVFTVLNGRGGMPTFGKDLTNEQIADIITYIRASWGNHAPPVARGIDSNDAGQRIRRPRLRGSASALVGQMSRNRPLVCYAHEETH